MKNIFGPRFAVSLSFLVKLGFLQGFTQKEEFLYQVLWFILIISLRHKDHFPFKAQIGYESHTKPYYAIE